MRMFCSWNSLKQLKIDKQLDMYYYEYAYKYEILIVNGDAIWFTELWIDTSKVKGIDISQNDTDKLDFENNYKSETQQL